MNPEKRIRQHQKCISKLIGLALFAPVLKLEKVVELAMRSEGKATAALELKKALAELVRMPEV